MNACQAGESFGREAAPGVLQADMKKEARSMSSLKELQDLIQEKYGLDPSALDPHASMRGSGIDSLALVEFLFDVEDKYGISLPDPDESLSSLADLAAVVDRLRAAQAA
jgi:acyl carrier protein